MNNDRKKIALSKMESVIHYASTSHACRSQILLHYFGETNTSSCNTCDVCLAMDKLSITKETIQSIRGLIKNSLNKKKQTVAELTTQLSHIDENEVVDTIQWLISIEQLFLNADQQLEWNTKQ